MNDETHSEPGLPLSKPRDAPETGLNPSLEDTKPIAFFCRAKPDDVDILDICLGHNRIFIGWPLLRSGMPYDTGACRTWIVNPKTCLEEEWQRLLAGQEGGHRQYSQNRNFIRRVKPGSIVVIPRPEQGAVYVARVTGGFEIVDSPPWRDDVRRLLSKQYPDSDADNNYEFIANVAQGWPVEEYKHIDLPRIPGWLRHSMFGRSTYGKFQGHPLDERRTAYDEFDRLLNGGAVRTDWTLELDEIKRRLVDSLTPTAFEHLVVSLLQLEHPDEIWHQTGGPGDGGIDGLGSNEKGEVVGLMQAKLRIWSAPQIEEPCRSDRRIERYAAVLILDGPDRPKDGTKLLDLAWVADTVRRHWRFLPEARAMRVGERRPQNSRE